MDIAYFKRFRMEITLSGRVVNPPPVPDGYVFLPWDGALLEAFARAKYLGFRDEIDTEVFPCLGEFAGCRRLMADIAGSPGFLPGATWLAMCLANGEARPQYCGIVQGVRDRRTSARSRTWPSPASTAAAAWARASCCGRSAAFAGRASPA